MRPVVLAALAPLAAGPVFAQATAPADSVRQLSEVTVYASRLGQSPGQTGRYVTIVPGASLASYPVNSLDDLLRLLPALEVQSRGSFGAQADITLRGSTFNQVLLLLDGMRLNDPLTGHFAGYLPIAPAEIEQIEIVRGPGAALYGPDAVGGFINIVTKTFAATHRPDQAEAEAGFMAGQWNLKSTNVGFYAQQKGLRLAGGVLNNSTDGQPRPAPCAPTWPPPPTPCRRRTRLPISSARRPAPASTSATSTPSTSTPPTRRTRPAKKPAATGTRGSCATTGTAAAAPSCSWWGQPAPTCTASRPPR